MHFDSFIITLGMFPTHMSNIHLSIFYLPCDLSSFRCSEAPLTLFRIHIETNTITATIFSISYQFTIYDLRPPWIEQRKEFQW